MTNFSMAADFISSFLSHTLRSIAPRCVSKDEASVLENTYFGATIFVRSDISPSNAITMSSPGCR